MTGDESARLVNLLIATWPTGPKAYVWTQAVTNLDAALANQTYAYLRDHDERITVATFLAQYRRIEQRQHDANTPPPTLTEPGLAPSQYVARVTARADAGDTAAIAELEHWRRVR